MRALAFVLLVLTAQSVSAQSPGDDPVFEPCLVKVKDEVEIPAQKEGTLIKLPVIEGSRVKAGDLLAVIDDREAQAAVKVARFGLQAAQERATDDIEERYATKAAEVARKDLEKDLDANQRHAGSVPDIEIIQKQLVVEKSDLQIEKAQKDQKLAGLDANTKQAELEAAKVALEKRTIVAPFSGEVVKLQRHQSEWVNPGDPILTLMRFETLWVEVFVPASKFDRGELLGLEVTVVIPRARGREVSLTGKVVHVGQVVESGGNFLVRAEVQNVPDGESWAIQPGMSPQGKMTIRMK